MHIDFIPYSRVLWVPQDVLKLKLHKTPSKRQDDKILKRASSLRQLRECLKATLHRLDQCDLKPQAYDHIMNHPRVCSKVINLKSRRMKSVTPRLNV
jgi:hypothetical protein